MITYALTENGSANKFVDGLLVANCLPFESDFVAWCDEGNTPAPYVAPALTVADYIAATQAHLDAYAQSWGYDDLRSACTYVGDPYARFNAEGLALRNWRSAVWAFLDATGSSPLPSPLPTKAEFIALLPSPPVRPVIA